MKNNWKLRNKKEITIKMNQPISQTEKFMNFLMEELEISEKENILLKNKKQFNCQQANFTMKRFAERIGSHVVKEIIRKQQLTKEETK